MRLPCFRKDSAPTAPWVLCVVLAGLIVVGFAPADLRADTTLNSGTTTVSTGTNFGGSLYVATTGTATLNVTGGNADAFSGYVGDGAGSSGTVLVSGGTWTNSNELFVGFRGTGVVQVTGGTLVSISDSTLGAIGGSRGTVDVSSGDWQIGGMLKIGNAGNGVLNISGGSVSNISADSILGADGGDGTVTVSGGIWQGGAMSIGEYGSGTLLVSGGVVESSGATLGVRYGGSGTATISSGTWINYAPLLVGGTGTGVLNVNGGYAGNSNGIIARESGSVGTVTVSSGTWANSSTLDVGGFGDGTLTVTGGSVTSTDLRVGAGGNSTGTLAISAGSIVNTNATLGSSAGTLGTATVTGGTWASSGNMDVGLYGTGTLTMSGGLVTVGGTLSQGTYGTINLNAGGTLQIGTGGAGGGLAVGDLTNNGTLAFNQSDNYIYSDSISGSGAVTKAGAGTLTLNGGNSFTGGVTISAGSLALGSANAIGSSGTIRFGGGAMQYSASNTADYSSRIKSSGSAIAIDTNGQSVTFATGLGSSNTGGLTKSGSGTLTLTASNGYTGRTQFNGGTLALSNTNALAGTGTLSFGGGSLQYSASNTRDYSAKILNSGSAISIDTNGQSVTFATGLGSSNTGGLTKSGSGTLTLTASNGYTGGTTISSGTLQIGAGATGSIDGNVVNNAMLTFNRSDALTYSGEISGSGGLTKGFPVGALTLSGSNGYTGATRINGGPLVLGNVNALAGTGTISFGGGGLQYSASNTVDYSSKIQNSTSPIRILTNGQNVTFASGLAGSNTGGLRKQDSGTLTLSASNGYTGATSVDGGVLSLENANALAGSGTISFRGGSLQYSASNIIDYSSKILNSGSAISIDTNGQNVIFASGLAASNTRGLTKSGAGTLTLTASNGYTGDTTISGGTLQVGNGSTTGSINGNVVNNAVLAFNRSDALTYSGTISGSGGLTKLGLGTLTLSGSSSYAGATAVDGGRLLVNGQLGNTAVTVNATGLLGGSGTILGDVTVGSSGTMSPGNSPGILTVGSLSLLAGSHTLMEITGTSVGLDYDQIAGTGSGGLAYGGSLDLVMSGSYADLTTFHLFSNFSSPSIGDFAAVGLDATGGEYAGLTFSDVGGVWTSTWTTNHQRLVFSTGTGDLVVVPEPSAYALLAIGAGFVGLMHRRKRRTATA